MNANHTPFRLANAMLSAFTQLCLTMTMQEAALKVGPYVSRGKGRGSFSTAASGTVAQDKRRALKRKGQLINRSRQK